MPDLRSVAKFNGIVPTRFIDAQLFTLTDAATITVDASQGGIFRVTLGGNRTMGLPSNPTDGQSLIFEVIQDGTGSRTLTWNAAYHFVTALPSPTLSTAAGKRDYIAFIYNSSSAVWACVSYLIGF